MCISRVGQIPELRRFSNGSAVYNISLATSEIGKIITVRLLYSLINALKIIVLLVMFLA